MDVSQSSKEEFPEHMVKALYMITTEFAMNLERNTHYETINMVLIWFDGKTKKRIDFTLLDNCIAVNYIENMYYLFPKFFDWGHKNIPFFPLVCKCGWIKLGEYALDEDTFYYYEKIKSIVLHVKSDANIIIRNKSGE